MIFLISYDRKNRVTTWIGTYDEGQMSVAQQRRLEAESEARDQHPQPEIVVLSAESKEALAKTHSRYFGPEVFLRDLRRVAEVDR